MATRERDHAQPDVAGPDTWAQLKSAAANWTRIMFVDQIQRTGPSLRDALPTDEAATSEPDPLADSELDLFDFEAEP